MSLTRDIGITLSAMQETIIVTSAAILSTAAASTGTQGWPPPNSTADAMLTTGGPLVVGGTSTVFGILFGRTIDRLASPLGSMYDVAYPSAYVRSTRGSTEADRRFQIGCKLQHGDSSGAGDMADYSTANQPAIRNYFSSVRSTDALNWEVSGRSTGGLDGSSIPATYDLRGAKRFVRLVVFGGKDRVTTESSGDEQARIGGAITFAAGRVLPVGAATIEKNSPESSSTSTV